MNEVKRYISTSSHGGMSEILPSNDPPNRYVYVAETDYALLEREVAELRENAAVAGRRPIGPDSCPFTNRPFWGNIEHPELGWVATYGGPFDTYTIPQRDDDDPSYYVYRYDHDDGYWVDGVEDIGHVLVDDQLYTSKDDPEELHAALTAEREKCEALRQALCDVRDGFIPDIRQYTNDLSESVPDLLVDVDDWEEKIVAAIAASSPEHASEKTP